MQCHKCKAHPCREGNPCVTKDSLALYEENSLDRRLVTVSAEIEALFYGEACRVDETLEFARRMGFKKLGLAFCVGFAEEAAILGDIISKEFELNSVCCKVGGMTKESLGMERRPWLGSASCNPAEQARVLNEAGCEFNILLGLCVGHDSVFYRHSKAPVTTLVVKDRKLGHNPVAALYCPYIRKNLGKPLKERTE
ncbi:MAG: DUF1847 domain-containing protein [Aminobacterium sp.]|jgi:uncharacterized metal-binding protein|uniref:Metal-binding protein n=1 Tax=bioreactor metagenome TaxID=1076179 RepID=A0A645AQ67_9ZZZZ|nr:MULTISPECIES: DUF1847 domain-containing protein [unclassified Aminobacterium]MDD2207676.1 DUF1847 domain-containing protein [Aminobacterium sp.]MDD3426286.1 DUF1847 domain-containing protein [Aminobacterium sp.]MDD3708500.1 DUF1847 domain-containing protein [Aminobacterium sp.]MDD4229702.1 DUF1847 domain-containing protein [Aminobacterium sp.]MDD4552503.1 DUF1847 domain-containing protein [Aminobacterium sp.]